MTSNLCTVSIVVFVVMKVILVAIEVIVQIVQNLWVQGAKRWGNGYSKVRNTVKVESINTRREAPKKWTGQLSQKKYLNANENYISWHRSVLWNSVKTQNLWIRGAKRWRNWRGEVQSTEKVDTARARSALR